MGWYKRNGKYKFKLPPRTVTCLDCEGHGTEQWACQYCQGQGTMKWRRAVAMGWKKSDLSDLYPDDPYCDCPSDYCHCSYTCETCSGDGYVPASQIETEITRVLIYGITHDIPPRYIPNRHTGHLEASRERELLSKAAVLNCQKRKWAHLHCDIFGHSLSLTEAGKDEAARRMPDWLSSHDSRWVLCDPAGRLSDDGCPNKREWDL